MKNKKMKGLFVFVPAILLVSFLLNSFVLKEKEAGEKITERTKSAPVTIVFRSADGGQTWQDIREGLSGKLEEGAFSLSRKIRICQVFYRQDPRRTQSIFLAPL